MGKKGDESRVKIIESATYCLLHLGDRKTTFQSIADHARVSQSLVVKYLINRENIFAVVLDYWIEWAKAKTERALSLSDNPEQQLRNYLKVSMDLFGGKGEFARVYLLLHYFAGVEEKYRIINSQIKKVAVDRIVKIIESGVRTGIFEVEDIQLLAKTIHNNLVGNVLSGITELPLAAHFKLPLVLEDTSLYLIKKNQRDFK